MAHYGGKTPKRHYMFANSPHISKINLGRLKGWRVKKNILKEKGQAIDLVDQYVDKSGKRRYKGNKQLRGSELLEHIVGNTFEKSFTF